MHKQISISWGRCQMGKERKKGDNERLTSGGQIFQEGPIRSLNVDKLLGSYSSSDEREPLEKNRQVKVENETIDKRQIIR